MATSLQQFAVDRQRISVSGISAGAFMAHQLHIAFSDVFCGAGLVAGGPYLTSQGSLWGALAHGLRGMPPPDHVQLSGIAETLAELGGIADLSNLKSSRVWAFHGTQDTVVRRGVSDALVNFYRRFMDEVAIEYVDSVDVVHAMPTDQFGTPADGRSESPYIVNCDYDAAGALLQHIHGPLQPRATEMKGELMEFDQLIFLGNAQAASMDNLGYVYFPSGAFEGRQCGVHVALHGCKQQRGAVGSTFAQEAGYNAWAESNDIIVLYPQACASNGFSLYNPLASWDWWGYSGQDYALRTGRQMKAIVDMVSTLVGETA